MGGKREGGKAGRSERGTWGWMRSLELESGFCELCSWARSECRKHMCWAICSDHTEGSHVSVW